MTNRNIPIPSEAIAALCRRHGIKRLAFFGSVLTDGFNPSSDIDILVEFEPETRIGLRYFAIEHELAKLFGRKVDLNTAGFLSPEFRDGVLRDAELQYDSASLA